MKHVKRYITLSILIIIFALYGITGVAGDYTRVDRFRGANMSDEVFDPMIAAWINEDGTLTVSIDGVAYNRGAQKPFLSDEMQVMVPLSFVREIFSCSAVVNEGEILLQHGTQEEVFPLYVADGCSEPAVSLEALCEQFKVQYTWDPGSTTAAVDTTLLESPSLPAEYDLRDEGRAPQIRDQGSDDTCWAFAAAAAVESSRLPDKVKISPKSIVKKTGISYSDMGGGDYMMALSWFLSWQGDSEVHVQEARFFERGDIGAIKLAVMKNGGVTSSIYIMTSQQGAAMGSYNPYTYGYRYSGTLAPNHDIVIIGWDDDYPAGNFYGGAPDNGAFICQNSWGSDFGDEGVFYVSYYDVNIGHQAVSYSLVEDGDNYSIIHQSDRYGWLGKTGFDRPSCLGAQVYTTGRDEVLKAAGFYATEANSSYELYVVSDFKDTSSLAGRIKVASGTLKDPGYYTVPFDEGVYIPDGGTFAVVLYINSPESSQPLAIEYPASRISDKESVDLSDGESYISLDGLDWTSIEKKAGGNLCLKVYADEKQQ